MTAQLLNGKWLAKQIHNQVKEEVEEYQPSVGRAPGLAVILVGDNPASKAYVANKEKTAKKCGFNTFDITLPRNSSTEQVKEAILSFNSNPLIDGILLQLPLPEHLDSNALINLIDPLVDADGLHPANQGLLMRGEGHLRPCTPLGAMKLIDLAVSGIDSSGDNDLDQEIPEADLRGKNAIVIGRSILVGKPMGMLLLERNATVVMAHSKTADLAARAREADIVVAAVGVPGLVKGDWIKKGAIVIDVGINRIPDGRLVGDVVFEDAAARASHITPVPGGVGPMTVAMLIYNTLQGYKRRHGLDNN
jgi:methylenetetrahydrofolate dehydrogenase (NADP+)/methenyltetrahydrofolate cyclohydrolase